MKNKIIYWASTGLLSLMMLFSAYAYFTNAAVKASFQHIGYPGYFRVELAIAKILGILVLLIPLKTRMIKEWAYAGFGITFISAFIAHDVNGDPISIAIMPLIALTLLVISHIFFQKRFSKTEE